MNPHAPGKMYEMLCIDVWSKDFIRLSLLGWVFGMFYPFVFIEFEEVCRRLQSCGTIVGIFIKIWRLLIVFMSTKQKKPTAAYVEMSENIDKLLEFFALIDQFSNLNLNEFELYWKASHSLAKVSLNETFYDYLTLLHFNGYNFYTWMCQQC